MLSEIEQRIKYKVESIGVPLKKWDVEIYRGVLTGCNDAFIITSEKRDEILANCTTKEERTKTAEIIRPILRGRDIRKYGYEWAELWLIATFPSRHYNIDEYPSIKQYLLSYGIERLEQTGKVHNIDGEKIKSRKKTNNKWFETQDSISYWDEFSKPKIVYPNMTKFLPFVYDTSGVVTNQKCFIITGKHLGYLTAFLNSSLFKYCFADRFPELQGKTRELSKIFMGEIPILEVNDSDEYIINRLMLDIQIEYSVDKAKRIDKFIFDLYHLSSEEQAHIGFIDYGEK
ncbi:MAG: type II restriction endonuclease [Bacteroides heparinolyticus]|nr:type II restriction endonuclease [Bacteroides heparinolyticus]